jgi:hypothetical protein
MPRHSLADAGVGTRRVVVGALVLVVLTGLAGSAAYLTRGSRTPARPAARATTASPSPALPVPARSPVAPASPSSRSALPVPPSTHDPLVFGKAAARVLWSYDTRVVSRTEWLAGLRRWMTGVKKDADWASVAGQVPSPVLWKEMAADGQHATGKATSARFPAAFTRALQNDPGAITAAYVYAVTVTGRQAIAWKGAPHGGSEARSVTLAVQCRPAAPCALAGVLPQVAP